MSLRAGAWSSYARRLAVRPRRGQAAFELVLMAPVMIIIMMLAVEFGMLMFGYIAVVNGVREGARYGVLNCGGTCKSTALITDRVIQRAAPALDGGSGTVEVWFCDRAAPTSGHPTRGDTVVVKAVRHHRLFILSDAEIDLPARLELTVEIDDPTSLIPKRTGSTNCPT